MLSKRKLMQLVKEGVVSGWDDPRIADTERPEAARHTRRSGAQFCRDIGVGRADATVEYGFLEYCTREV